MNEPLEITPQELQRKREQNGTVAIIDVREPAEWAIAHLPGSELIPMQQVPAQLQKLEALSDDQSLAILCHHGVRSLNVALWLREHGVENCSSVSGGIDRWSREIDSSIPTY